MPDISVWVIRAAVLGVLTVALRTVLGFAMVYWPTQGFWLRPLCLLVLVCAAAGWGVWDGRADRLAHPEGDPTRQSPGFDWTLAWLWAGLAGGVGGGVLAWLVGHLPGFDLGDNSLLFEVSAAAAFIVLAIFVPGVVGVSAGRFLVNRRAGHSGVGVGEQARVGSL